MSFSGLSTSGGLARVRMSRRIICKALRRESVRASLSVSVAVRSRMTERDQFYAEAVESAYDFFGLLRAWFRATGYIMPVDQSMKYLLLP